MVVGISEIAGYFANQVLVNFEPVMNYDAVTHSISIANALIIEFPEPFQYVCTFILIGYACFALFRWVKKKAVQA